MTTSGPSEPGSPSDSKEDQAKALVQDEVAKAESQPNNGSRREFIENAAIAIGGGIVGAITGPIMQAFIDSRREDSHAFESSLEVYEDFTFDIPNEVWILWVYSFHLRNSGDFTETGVNGYMRVSGEDKTATDSEWGDRIIRLTSISGFGYTVQSSRALSVVVERKPQSLEDMTISCTFSIPRLVPGDGIVVNISVPLRFESAQVQGLSDEVIFSEERSFDTDNRDYDSLPTFPSIDNT